VKFRVRPPAASQIIDASAALNLGG
jgi:hypothetical protein